MDANEEIKEAKTGISLLVIIAIFGVLAGIIFILYKFGSTISTLVSSLLGGTNPQNNPANVQGYKVGAWQTATTSGTLNEAGLSNTSPYGDLSSNWTNGLPANIQDCYNILGATWYNPESWFTSDNQVIAAFQGLTSQQDFAILFQYCEANDNADFLNTLQTGETNTQVLDAIAGYYNSLS
jgi:hypothetical protein